MSIVVNSSDAIYVYATIDGVVSTIPRAMANADYQRLLGWGMRKISLERGVYQAFPSAITSISGSLVAIYSSGEGHGNSDRQIWLRSDNNFVNWTTGTFVADSAPNVYDNSFLDGLLTTGQTANFKGVYTVEKTGGGYSNTVQSTLTNGPDTYAIWSQKPIFVGGKWLTTAYRTSSSPTQTALVQSTDEMKTWTFSTLIAADAGKQFSEAAIAQCANGDLVALIREDSGSRDVYTSRSTDSGATWSAPTITALKGTQPALLVLSDNSVIAMTGDRSGTSGLNPAGTLLDGNDITGISAWKSTDNGVTWGFKIMLAAMWSTDGGQPMPVELSTGDVGFLCYLAPGATTGSVGVEPGIYWVQFSPSGMV